MVATVPTRPWECQDNGQFHIPSPIPAGSTARCVRCGVSGMVRLARLKLRLTGTVML
jgi:hypothetical protein